MSSAKIRFVKCPNCWNVLPESVDVPVYRCGGCDKILQAKYRQQQEQEQEQEQEQDGEKSEMQQVGEDKASGSSRSEEGVGNSSQDVNNVEHPLQPSDDEFNIIPHGYAAEANSHVMVVEEEINNDEAGIIESSSNVDEQQTDAPPNLQRIMSGSTEYLDPCSTFSGMLSETCNSPSTQTIHQHRYDASLSSFDEERRRFLSRRRETTGVFPANGNGSGYVDKRSSFNLPPRPRLLPLYQSDGRGSPSERVPPKNYRHSMSYNSKPPVSPDEEKMKLLKIVYELEEQLKKTCSFPATTTTSPRSHELHDPQRQRQHWNGDDHYLRCSRIIPFSAEVGLARGDHRFPLPRDRQHSAPLPPPPYKKAEMGASIINSYRSWPSSPVPHVDELLLPWEEDPSYGFLKMQRSNLQKKKHLRPIARAAPFIACKKCSEFLELPGDFLLSKGRRRCHRVRCGGCSTVMRFSLENRTYLVPYYEDEEEDDNLDFRAPAPPPSESSMNMTSSSTSRGKIRYSDNGASSSMQKRRQSLFDEQSAS